MRNRSKHLARVMIQKTSEQDALNIAPKGLNKVIIELFKPQKHSPSKSARAKTMPKQKGKQSPSPSSLIKKMWGQKNNACAHFCARFCVHFWLLFSAHFLITDFCVHFCVHSCLRFSVHFFFDSCTFVCTFAFWLLHFCIRGPSLGSTRPHIYIFTPRKSNEWIPNIPVFW